jgi:hypothetical protein
MIPTENRGMTAADVKAGVQLIQQVMAEVMIKDVHYGTIPGTPKPTLYKAGSEKILTTFRIAAYPKEVDDLSTYDEARYRVKVHGIHQPTGMLIGVGIGECSSNEEKYKWRKPVCDQEFEETPEDRKRTVWKKSGQGPYQLKQVRMNPTDVANTILKMAKKRAQIDMTLTATAASDVFDQDLEDLPEGMVGGETKAPLKEPQKKAAEKKPDTTSATGTISDIDSKQGETKGKPWTRYDIMIDGVKYSTFSDTFADIARTAKESGAKVTFTFTAGERGNTIKTLEVIEPRDPGAEG